MLLHIIKKQNPNNKIEMILNIFLCISWWIEIYIYISNICNYNLKMEIFFKKKKWFLTFTKIVVSISDVIPHPFNHVCRPCE